MSVLLPLLLGGCNQSPFGLKHEIHGNTVTITGCDEDASGELVIPDTIKGKTVTAIGQDSFKRCVGLTSITIPDGVTRIGESAFESCNRLTSVTIGDSVASIGKSAFESCNRLTSVTIGDSVASIGHSAFRGCARLRSITIPDSVTSIGGWAFRHAGLTSITIPDSVTSIGDSAFYLCRSLTSVTIGNGVTSIGNFAFYNCTRLTSLTIGYSVANIGRVEPVTRRTRRRPPIIGSVFGSCPSLTSITFLGDAPNVAANPFPKASPTIYRKPEARGWGDTFAGRPVKLISEKP